LHVIVILENTEGCNKHLHVDTQNVIQGKRGYGRAGVGRTEFRTFLSMLLDRTNVSSVK